LHRDKMLQKGIRFYSPADFTDDADLIIL